MTGVLETECWNTEKRERKLTSARAILLRNNNRTSMGISIEFPESKWVSEFDFSLCAKSFQLNRKFRFRKRQVSHHWNIQDGRKRLFYMLFLALERCKFFCFFPHDFEELWRGEIVVDEGMGFVY